jgi:hypothetical protein
MPEIRPAIPLVIPIALLAGALTLVVIAVLIYTGDVPVGEDVRMVAVLAVGAAAFADFVVAIWFFRKSQSS